MLETNDPQEQKAIRKKRRREIDAIGWGVFFIWVGVAILADLGWGIGLVGVGLIILASYAAKERLTSSAATGAVHARF